MASLNKVLLIGNLTRDPEMYELSTGTLLTFGLAVDNKGKNNEGKTCFIDITAWDGLAKVCKTYLKKGNSVFVEGQLYVSEWEDNDKTKRKRICVKANSIQFLSCKNSTSDNTKENNKTGEIDEKAVQKEKLPF